MITILRYNPEGYLNGDSSAVGSKYELMEWNFNEEVIIICTFQAHSVVAKGSFIHR